VQAFVDGSFFESGGKPYCKLHYHAQTGSVCGGCQKAITGRSVNAMGKNWHPEHFVWCVVVFSCLFDSSNCLIQRVLRESAGRRQLHGEAGQAVLQGVLQQPVWIKVSFSESGL
jgi:hypothetical protein